MKKFSLKDWLGKIQLVALRFPFTLFFLLGLAILFFIQINNQNAHIHQYMWAFFSIGIPLSVTLELFSEELEKIFLRVIINLSGIILLLIYCFFLPEKFQPIHYFQLIALGITFILTSFFVSFIKKNNDISFWEFSKNAILQLFISAVFAQVLLAGLSLAVLSLKLLFKIDIQLKVYQDLAVICYVLFASVYFLSNITAESEMHKQEFSFDKFVKVLGLYILLPILAIYSVILYVYLGQIVVKWELPNGWVSTLVSVLGLGGFLSMLILFPLRLENENKVVKHLSKYFHVFLLPLLVLMSVGIFRRLEDYGITINRLYVLILNVWLYGICIYLFITKARHLKWIVISFTAVLFLSSVGSWSVYNIAKRSMLKEIGQLLSDAKLLKDGKVIDNTHKLISIDLKIGEPLNNKIEYVCQNYGSSSLQPFFNDSIQKLNAWQVNEKLGIELAPTRSKQLKSKYFQLMVENLNQQVDLKPYSVMFHLKNNNNEPLFKNDKLKVSINNSLILATTSSDTSKLIFINLKPKLKELIQSDKNNDYINCEEFVLTGNKYKLIINNVSGNYSVGNDSISIVNFDANLLLK